MAKIFSIANFKGGVGKTTLTQNFGYYLHRQGKKVLILDLDPQANLTYACGFVGEREAELNASIYHLLTGEATADDAIVNANLPDVKEGRLDLIPSGAELISAEPKMGLKFGLEGGIERLERALADVIPYYDYILIDNSPSMGMITQNALRISDYVLIPVKAEYLPVKGLTILIETMKYLREAGIAPRLEIGGFILMQYSSRAILYRELKELIEENFPGWLFDTHIRQNIAIAEAQSQGMDVFTYDPESHGAIDFGKLFAEFEKRFDIKTLVS